MFHADITKTYVYSPIQGGVDSRDLYHGYIMVWIQDLQLTLLDLCKAEKVFPRYNNIISFIWCLSGNFANVYETSSCRYPGPECIPNIQPLPLLRKCLKGWKGCLVNTRS